MNKDLYYHFRNEILDTERDIKSARDSWNEGKTSGRGVFFSEYEHKLVTLELYLKALNSHSGYKEYEYKESLKF